MLSNFIAEFSILLPIAIIDPHSKICLGLRIGELEERGKVASGRERKNDF